MRVSPKLMILVAAVLMCAPGAASADTYLAPFLGVNFANNSGDGRSNFGANGGWMANGIIGAEFDLGYAPSFFGNQGLFGSNSVLDVMGNIIVGVPAGRSRHGGSVRPYGTLGFGLLRSEVNAGPSGTAHITNNDPGMNAGVGVMGFPSRRVGVRGDVRYFRDVHSQNVPNGFGIDFGSFHFWRASFGLVIR